MVGDDYRVNLDIFEGPLDLLLHLIRKNDLDVYDIPVSFVLEEYMKYLDTLRELDIDMAGDFLLMAAELAHIKSRMLLPDEAPDDEPHEEDPRADLVKRLLEYQQYKEASEQLLKRPMLRRDVFVKQYCEKPECEAEGPIEGNVFELIEAFSKLLKKVSPENFHDVAVDRISVNERIYQIVGHLKNVTTVSIEELIGDALGKYPVVVTFLALLEMCKLRMIKVYQGSVCGPIHVQLTMKDVSEDDMSRIMEIEISSAKENAPMAAVVKEE